ncbi:MAG: type II toxin-antitoxin system HipA family toxin [Coriobacteriales bacterium]|nr:type II toxin-antitoxin system HipA family toxin [Coriobacteriales bacterium]
MTRKLSVFIAGSRAGTLAQNDNGARTFTYDAEYEGLPLSLSMPVSNQTYPPRVVDPYLLGLLPDDEHIRRQAGKRFGVSGNNPFALLSHMGLDCPGAIQFCPPEDEARIERPQELIPLTDEQIAQRLSPRSGRQADTWFHPGERWSLGGHQSKFALRLVNGAWYECGGAAATTHILKPGIEGMSLEALDEYVTMRIAHSCGLPAARVDYQVFADVPAIVVTRYDRRVVGATVERIHQEDLCQAMGVSPEKKYAEDGGPSTPHVLNALRQTTDPQRSVRVFAAMLFFNYLMGAPDAHAKNYSLLHMKPNLCTLAPLYDVASGLPYGSEGNRPPRMAMSIGGENRLGYVHRTHVERFAQDAKMDSQDCVNLMANLCQRIMRSAQAVIDQTQRMGVEGADELADRLIPKVEANCRRTLQQL